MSNFFELSTPEGTDDRENAAAVSEAVRLGAVESLVSVSRSPQILENRALELEEQVFQLSKKFEEQEAISFQRAEAAEKEIQTLGRRNRELEQRLRESEVLSRGGMAATPQSFQPAGFDAESPIFGKSKAYLDVPTGSYDTTRGLSEADLDTTASIAQKDFEKTLWANRLESTDPKKGLIFIKDVSTWLAMSEKGRPWGFLGEAVLSSFTNYLVKIKRYQLNDTKPLEFHYAYMDRGPKNAFVHDFRDFIKYDNGLEDKDLLRYLKMTSDKALVGFEGRDYVRMMQMQVTRMPELAPLDATTVFLEGLHTEVRKLLMLEFPYLQSCNFDDVTEKALKKIQDIEQRDRLNTQHGKAPQVQSGGRGGRGSRSDEPRETSGGVITSNCGNCHRPGHVRMECTRNCTRCIPSCGKPPKLCPQFLKWKKGDNGDQSFSNKVATPIYKASNARIQRAVRAVPISISVSTSNIILPRAKRMKKQVTHKTNDSIVDSGANGLILNNNQFLDKDSLCTSDANIFLPDSSGVSSTESGKLCGQPAHIVTAFDKNLFPIEFFTNQNAFLLFIDDELKIIRRSDSTLGSVADLLLKADSSGNVLLSTIRENGLYPTSVFEIRNAFPLSVMSNSMLQANASYFSAKLSNLEEQVLFWHVTLGHPSAQKLISMVDNNIYDGFPLTVKQVKENITECPDCYHGNMSQKRHPREAKREYIVGKTMSIDIIVGGGEKKNPVRTHSGEGYAVLCIDRGSDKSWCFMTSSISNLLEYIQRMDRIYELAGYNLEEIQIDASFATKAITTYCAERRRGVLSLEDDDFSAMSAISPLVTAPHEHAQNGAAECLARVFYSGVTKQLHWANLGLEWWGDCALWFNDARNDQSSDSRPTMSRNEVWNGERTDLQRTPIFPFGSRVKSHVPLSLQTWETTRCRDGIVIGRAKHHKGSIVIRHLDTMKTVVRYTFKVLGQRDTISAGSKAVTEIELPDDTEAPEMFFDHISGATSTRRIADTLQQDGTKYREAKKTDLTKAQQRDYWPKLDKHFTDGSTGVPYKIVGIGYLITDALGRKSKTPQTPMFRHYNTNLFDFEPRDAGDFEWMPCAELLRDPDTEWNGLRNTHEVNCAEIGYAMLSDIIDEDITGEFSCYHVVLDRLSVARVDVKDIPPPKKFKDLATHPEGKQHLSSFLREVDSFARNGMMQLPDIDIKDIPPELIMQLMPIWHKKYEGLDFSKFKCRMVGLGQNWLNIYGEPTTSGMAAMDTVKIFLAVGAATGMNLSKVDSDTAFLQAELLPTDRPYYLRAPPGVPASVMPYIMQPSAYVYGHPKAGRQFTRKYREMLLRNDWVRSVFDPCSYTLINDIGYAHLLTIVDDSPILASDIPMRDFVHASIAKSFKITIDLECKHVAGLDVEQHSNGTYTLSQDGACEDLFDNNIENWRTLDLDTLPDTPMAAKSRMAELTVAQALRDAIPCSPAEIKRVQSQLGSINWITITWPDLLYSFKIKAPCATKATKHDVDEINRILLYMVLMYRTGNKGLTIGSTAGVLIYATVDSSHACYDNMRGHAGGTIHLGPQFGAFSAFSEKLPIATDSTAATEGVGGHLMTRRVIPIRYYLEELLHSQSKPSRIAMDNVPYMQGALGEKGLGKNVKHVLIRLRITDEALEKKEITLEHLTTEDMVADILTKPLASKDFHRLRRVLLGMDPVRTSLEYVRDNKLYCNYLLISFT